MGFLQALIKQLKLLGLSNSVENELLEQKQREYGLFLESANYNPMLNHVVRIMSKFHFKVKSKL